MNEDDKDLDNLIEGLIPPWEMSDSDYLTILGIDPSFTNLGIAICRYNPETEIYIVDLCRTFYVDKHIKSNGLTPTNREKCIDKVREVLETLLIEYKIDYVFSEKPFYNSLNPNTFGNQMECVNTIRQTVNNNENLRCNSIFFTPSYIKNAVGVQGNDGNKDNMLNAIKKLKEERVFIFNNVNIEELDDHAIDALAMCKAGISKKI